MKKNNTDVVYDRLSRRDLRSLIFQLLYALESTNYEVSLESLVDQINRGYKIGIPLDGEAVVTVQDIVEKRSDLDEQIKPLLHNWRFDRISVPTKLILRFALWELAQQKLDPSIVMNEAVELAKCYAEEDAYKFINGILDEKVALLRKKKKLA